MVFRQRRRRFRSSRTLKRRIMRGRGRRIKRRRFSRKRSGRRRRHGRRFRRSKRKARRFGRKIKRRGSAVTHTYERLENDTCKTTPGRQHFRDYTVGGIPTQLGFIYSLGFYALAKKLTNKNFDNRQFISASGVLVQPELSKMNPDLVRVPFREICDFTVYNTGTSTAYMTCSTLRKRKSTKWETGGGTGECDHLLRVPNTVTTSPFSALTAGVGGVGYGMSYSLPNSCWNVATPSPTFAQLNAFWDMTTNLIDGTSGATGYGFSFNRALREFHAFQQFQPYTVWGAGLRNVQNIYTRPIGAGSIAGGTEAPQLATPASMFTSANITAQASNNVFNSNVTNYCVVFAGLGANAQSFSALPNYDERRRGPIDEVFKRRSRRIILHPGQSYTFRVKTRRATLSVYGPYAMYLRSPYNVASSSAVYPDSPATMWGQSLYTLPTMSHSSYGTDTRGIQPTVIQSFCIRGNTQISNTIANTITEAGPAEVVIKRRYRCFYKAYLKKQKYVRAVDKLVHNMTAVSTTNTGFSSMYPTSVPVKTAFGGTAF